MRLIKNMEVCSFCGDAILNQRHAFLNKEGDVTICGKCISLGFQCICESVSGSLDELERAYKDGWKEPDARA